MTVDYPTWEEIRVLCTEQSFERGVNYYNQDRIQKLDIDGGEVEAMVRGTHNYEVVVDVESDPIYTYCSCPYDYAGDCKHIVAVLLAVDARDGATSSDNERHETAERVSKTVNVEELIEQTAPEDLRAFLLECVEDDSDVRDRFIAFVGEDTGKTVYDYKQEIDRLFEDAAGRRGMVEYATRIDFSQYHALAETHRERGHVDAATDIYRALAEVIRENMNRIDDSSGHYGRELKRAVESYAETIEERNLDHEEKQPYIEHLFEEFIEADYGFVRDDYDDALRTLCTTTADLEYWLDLLDTHVSAVSLEPTAIEKQTTSRTAQERETTDTDESGIPSEERSRTGDDVASDHERTDDILYTSDFTDVSLTVNDFTSGTLDIEHLAVGSLELGHFVGDAFEKLRVDTQTTVEKHTIDVEPIGSSSAGTEVASSLRTQSVFSTYIYLLKELDKEDALSALYEKIYLENSQFCKQYAERLIDQGDEERAIAVIENGIDTFRSTTGLRWLVADLYRDRNLDEYRKTLKQLFLDHSEWDAYDDLKVACDNQRWESIYEELVTSLEKTDSRRLIDVYVHEGELERAFFCSVE